MFFFNKLLCSTKKRLLFAGRKRKDFSYLSGERQIANQYKDIRRDHRARYELADKILPKNSSVADVFCGNGYGTNLLARNRTALGIDGSAEAIAIARKKYSSNRARFDCQCFPNLNLKNYDSVVSFESVEHVNNGENFLQYLIDSVLPNGCLIFSTPNETLLPFDPAIQIHHVRHYTLEETLNLAANNGCRIETWFGQNVYQIAKDGKLTVLNEDSMELQREKPGQFTTVVATKT